MSDEQPEREISIDTAIRTAMSSMMAQDSDPLSYPERAPSTFSTPTPFGTTYISDEDKLFTSQREPIIRWITWWVAVDVFDNWFKVIDPASPDSLSLDRAVQPILRQINAKQNLTRLFTFERRYGTAVLLCSYSGFGSEASWISSIYETATGLNLPIGFEGQRAKLEQITPYPWSKVDVQMHDENESSLRFGYPEFYTIDRGIEEDSVSITETQSDIHWSRIIHAATRLDENTYEGESVVDPVWDDATGGRNMRWGEYETIFRVGSGFPWFKFPWATQTQIQNWIDSGVINSLNARGYFASGQEGEEIEFIGPKNVTLNPEPYNEMWFNNIAMATRIPKDVLKGVSAGTVSGSEVNERSYWNFIKSEQELVTPVVKELIDRLIDTGQIQHEDRRRGAVSKNYEIKWNFPEIVSEKDRATIDFLDERRKAQSLEYMTINELREKDGLKPVEGGDVVPGLLKSQKSFQGQEEKRPNPESRRPEEQANEETEEE